MQPTSSPGVPYLKLGKTNHELFSQDFGRGLVLSAVVQRIRAVLSLSREKLSSMSALDLVEAGLVDPIKVFIKQEPHKIAKIESGKLRIISNLSIVDQLIERILCAPQNKAEISRWTSLPSKPGMGLHDEGLKELYAEVITAQRKHGVLAETDVSGWDWSVPDWLLRLDYECRARLYRAPPGSALEHLLWFRGYAVARKVFCLSDGTLHEQLVPGIQASGSYNTSSSNSRMRVALSYVVGASWVIAMGDDNIETAVAGAREHYVRLGFTVKDYRLLDREGWFDFCSTTFSGSWRGTPTQWLRTVFRYLSKTPASLNVNPQFRAQLVDDLRHMSNQQEVVEHCDSIVELESKRCQ